MTRIASIGLVVLAGLVLTGCRVSEARRGVESSWREPGIAFTAGTTTEADVLTALGPPSQVVPIGSRTVYYYLLEVSNTNETILLVYNNSRTRVRYDRAIFFFDANGVLEFHSVGPDPEAEEEAE